ncbi:MAG: tetratricopeptide repeat protein, partial [Bacteroidia bacterium]
MNLRYSLSIALLILFFNPVFCSNKQKADSLLNVLKTSIDDTNKVNVLRLLSAEYKTSDTTKALSYSQQSLALAQKLNFTKGIGNAYVRMGSVYKHLKDATRSVYFYKKALEQYEKIAYVKGEMDTYMDIASIYKQQASYDDAFEYYTKIMTLATQTNDSVGLIDATRGYANIYRYKGDYVKSLDYYLKGIKLAEATGDKSSEGGLLTNMAIIYSYQHNLNEELKIRMRALEIYQETKDSMNLIIGYNTIGEVYYEQKEKAKAIEMFNKSMDIINKIGVERANYKYVAETYDAFAMIAFDEKNYSKAKENYQKSLDFMIKGKEKKAITDCFGNMADVAVALKKWDEAEMWLMKKLDLSKEIGHKRGEMDADKILARVMYEKGNYKKAYDYQAEYLDINQALLNETSTQQLAEMQTRFDTEKKEKELQLQNVEIKEKNTEVKQRTIIMYSFVGVSAVFLAMAFFSMRQVRQKRKAFLLLQGQHKEMMVMNNQIIFQKEIIEEKNKDITDSIHYAKHIQEAILPPEDLVYEYLKESFILYKPKDIVSGD